MQTARNAEQYTTTFTRNSSDAD